ncbi:MAG: large conductance mechanosensitive channel protein MscL [Chloroflexota bacterium]
MFKGFFKEFKEFAMRGNVVDLAVGVIMGAAFGKIVTSFVNDIVMPLVGLLLGNRNFADLYVVLSGDVPPGTSLAEAKNIADAITWNYGAFLLNIVDFLIIAFFVFLLVKWINSLKGPVPEPAPTTKTCVFCHSSIHIEATRCPYCTSPL